MRDFQAALSPEGVDRAFEYAKARGRRTFPARFKKKMHAEAYAQEYPASGNVLPDRIVKSPAMKLFHGIAERADARKDKFIRPLDIRRTVRNPDASAFGFKGLPDAVYVAHSVIYDRDHRY